MQGDHQYERLPIYFSNTCRQPFDLGFLGTHELQHDGFLRFAAIIASGRLQREAFTLFGDDTQNGGSTFGLGINAMNGLAAHFTRLGSLAVDVVSTPALAGPGYPTRNVTGAKPMDCSPTCHT